MPHAENRAVPVIIMMTKWAMQMQGARVTPKKLNQGLRVPSPIQNMLRVRSRKRKELAQKTTVQFDPFLKHS